MDVGKERGIILKRNTSTIVLTGLFAAMITLMTAFIGHIPYGVHGGYIHFGDALIYIAAAFLPRPYAIAAAAIGGGLADLLTAPVWAPATIVIKTLIVLPFTSKKNHILCSRNLIAAVTASVITIFGYFIAEGIIFGSFLIPFASIFGNVIQAIGSAVIFILLAVALEKSHTQNTIKKFLYED